MPAHGHIPHRVRRRAIGTAGGEGHGLQYRTVSAVTGRTPGLGSGSLGNLGAVPFRDIGVDGQGGRLVGFELDDPAGRLGDIHFIDIQALAAHPDQGTRVRHPAFPCCSSGIIPIVLKANHDPFGQVSQDSRNPS